MTDYNRQSVEIPNTKSPGQTGIYRNPSAVNGFQNYVTPDIQNVYDLFKLGLTISEDRPCMGVRSFKNPETGERGPYIWQTYRQINDRITNVGSGLVNYLKKNAGINSTHQIPIGIWSVNRPEWYTTDLACAAYGMYSISLYDTLGSDTTKYIINQAEISTIVCSGNHISDLLKLKKTMPSLKTIISMDDLDEKRGGKQADAYDWGAEHGVTITDLRTIEEDGKQNRRENTPCKADDLFCIMYTSGTTGIPKGVMLTHTNIISEVRAGIELFGCQSSDISFSYLPLAHIYQRIFEITVYIAGGCVGFYAGDSNKMMEDIQELKPTILPCVPRVLNKIYSTLAAATIEAPGSTGSLARRAVASKLANLEAGKGFIDPYWDNLLFNQAKQLLGGNVRYISTGSAPISKDVLQFLRVALCCDIREGYGITETSCVITFQIPGEYKALHVGAPIACSEYKLVDVPEMGYFSTDPQPQGEILVRGKNVFKGYFKEPEKTREVFDEEGWFRTGDIGLVDERGCLVIIDRKKNIFKLAQGEYIAPEKIENVYIKHPAISQIYIHGDSLQHSLVAIVVPDQQTLAGIVASKLPAVAALNLSFTDLCRQPQVNTMIFNDLVEMGKMEKLQGFEFPKAIYLESEPFTLENDLLTPTFKVKRNQAAKHYRKNIDDLYSSLKNSNGSKAKL